MKIALTGAPGIGKTTICEQLASTIPGAGGVVTSELRDDGGRRCGFAVRDVATGEQGILAHLDRKSGPKVGKYRVDTEECKRILLPPPGTSSSIDRLDSPRRNSTNGTESAILRATCPAGPGL